MNLKEKNKMNYMNIMMPRQNMAFALAEDVGAPELRSPLNSGMRSRLLPFLRRLFARKASVQVA